MEHKMTKGTKDVQREKKTFHGTEMFETKFFPSRTKNDTKRTKKLKENREKRTKTLTEFIALFLMLLMAISDLELAWPCGTYCCLAWPIYGRDGIFVVFYSNFMILCGHFMVFYGHVPHKSKSRATDACLTFREISKAI